MKTVILLCFFCVTTLTGADIAYTPFTNPLPIPPIIDKEQTADGFQLMSIQAKRGEMSFFGDTVTETMGYNGSYLGPTIRVRTGERVRFNIENSLGEPTTLHWHGLHVPAEMDGGPRQVIDPGEIWQPEFSIRQQAATLWYHPHLMSKTAEHVYNGLAGFFIIDDERSDSLSLPREYVVDDIPIVFHERRFSEDGTFTYKAAMADVMHGYTGNALLVNGMIAPKFEVTRKLIRLRILNGSNSSIHRFRLSDDRKFSVIASDGGFLPQALERQSIVLSPGERAEIVIAFSDTSEITDLLVDTYGGSTYQALRFQVKQPLEGSDHVPEKIFDVRESIHDTSFSEPDRVFEMQSMGMGGRLMINGKRMDMARIDEIVQRGKREVWELRNPRMGMMALPHSFHVHDVQFKIVQINGEDPTPELSGRKDTVLLWPGDVILISLVFEEYTGIYMYHCHLLEHEDAGMMGQIEVTSDNRG